MHATLVAIKTNLEKVVAQIQGVMPNDEPLGIAHGNWSFPQLTKAELIEEAQLLIDQIDERGEDDIGAAEARLKDYPRRLEHLRGNTVPQMWSNAGQAVPAYMLTLQGLRHALGPALQPDAALQAQAIEKLKKLTRQLRSMEARIRDLDPRTASVASMVERIEQAYEAADQLPADLEALSEARAKIAKLLEDAGKDQSHLLNVRQDADGIDKQLKAVADEAKEVLKRCESAYRASTSVGLAAAFSERSDALEKSITFWIVGLVIALGLGGYLGAGRLHELSALLSNPSAETSLVVVNLLLSVFSVAAPVWFAWLATKQIGQRFRLSEDYAFKASVSRAYEGFRAEAARFDDNMEARLLSSALTRFDELPLRLVEPDAHGSPWHEIASSDVVKQAMQAIPDFGEKVKELATAALSKRSPAEKATSNAKVQEAE